MKKLLDIDQIDPRLLEENNLNTFDNDPYAEAEHHDPRDIKLYRNLMVEAATQLNLVSLPEEGFS